MSLALPIADQAASPRVGLDQPLHTATRPFHVMTKPIGPICNLDCRYCFYLEKERLYQDERRWKMPAEVLENYIRQYIQSQPMSEVGFAWQGGEPTLLGVDYFRNVRSLQDRHARGKTITNALQTNGTLLDDEWCEFLAKEKFLVGLSVDGPRELHNTYRVDKQGLDSFDDVWRGLKLLKKHGVEFNTLTVINRANSREPLKVYKFLREFGSGFMQFIPLVERTYTGNDLPLDYAPPAEPGEEAARYPVTDWSVEPRQLGKFLITIFDEWVGRDVGRVFVQTFDVALGNWIGAPPGLCVFSPTCGSALAIEHNGDVYSCDHYVYPKFKLGNLTQTPLAQLVESPFQRKFGQDKLDALPRYCIECDVRFACHGECPKHRFIRTPTGDPGLNYLCAGYKAFFTHVDPYMKQMSMLLHARRAPAEIVGMIRSGWTPDRSRKPSPLTQP
jgi:uncharacterized protein